VAADHRHRADHADPDASAQNTESPESVARYHTHLSGVPPAEPEIRNKHYYLIASHAAN